MVGVGTLKLIHSDVASVLEHWVNCGERFRSFAKIVEEWAGKRIFVAPRDNRVDGSPTGAGRRTNRLTMEKMVLLASISRLTSNNRQPFRDELLSSARSAAETSQDVPARSADQTLRVIRTGKSTKLRRGNQDSRSDVPHDQNFGGN